MSSSRRIALVGLAAAAVVSSALVATSTSTAAAPSLTAAEVAAGQTAVLLALPVTSTLASAEPQAELTAIISLATKGRPIALQVKRGDGWKTVQVSKETKKGLAEFVAPASKGGRPLTYRVFAYPYRGLAAVTSAPVSAQWLAWRHVREA